MSLTFCRCAAGQVHRGQIGFLRCAYLFSAGAGILSPYCNMATDNWKDAHSIYDLVAKDINGEDVLLSKYEGHVVLIVNVASRCGLTDANYKQLEKLHEKYASRDPLLNILGFPCNQFASREPKSNEKVSVFSSTKYGVIFYMFAKVSRNGRDAHLL